MGKRDELRLTGLGFAPGIGIGRAVCIESREAEIYRFPLPADQVEGEVDRLHRALDQATAELRQLRLGQSETSLEEDLGGVLDAHLLLLKDPEFLGRVEAKIRAEQVNAEWAVHRTIAALTVTFEGFQSEYLRERSHDLTNVGSYLVRALQGVSHHELSEIEGEVILVANDLPPADAIRLGRERVAGLAIAYGGGTSHTSIIARSLNLPAVGGIEGVMDLVTDEDPVIVDGEEGVLILHPRAETLATYRRRQRQLADQDRQRRRTSSQEAVTADGVAIELQANIDLPEEVIDAVAYGARGIGLYRSEFLYIERSPDLPGEEEHLEIYRALGEGVAPHPVIIRTYDLGGRKLARELMQTRGENPALGLRGIRLTLARPEIFRTQIRALLRAAADYDIRIMLPMISSLDEIRAFRRFADQLLQELKSEGLACREEYSLGIMIEVPAAAAVADLLAREVDFFSIGTNDLVQYTLAVDRNNEEVRDLFQPFHPAVLRLLETTVVAASEQGIAVGLCGEMGGDPLAVPLLVGLGLRRLSVSPRRIPEVKAVLRDLRLADLRQLVKECMALPTGEQVEDRLRAFSCALKPAALAAGGSPRG